jgi:hypothetical protein
MTIGMNQWLQFQPAIREVRQDGTSTSPDRVFFLVLKLLPRNCLKPDLQLLLSTHRGFSEHEKILPQLGGNKVSFYGVA